MSTHFHRGTLFSPAGTGGAACFFAPPWREPLAPFAGGRHPAGGGDVQVTK
jgi:hypothetical protein